MKVAFKIIRQSINGKTLEMRGLEMEFEVNLKSHKYRNKVLGIQFYWLLLTFTSRSTKRNKTQEEFMFYTSYNSKALAAYSAE